MEQTIKVAAVMTAPRYELTYARNNIEKACQALGIRLIVSQGVFYGQCMQTMLENLVGEADYAITIDFDSLFTTAHVQALLKRISSHPEIDALAALQIRRSKPTMLGTVAGGEVKEGTDTKEVIVTGDPIRGETAHFGLTVLDLKKLANVPKPWFWAKPNAHGRWDTDKVDDDVHFWLQWKAAGNSIYFDPEVRIGHIEEMVVMHDENLKPVHVYPAQWEAMQNASRAC